MGKDMIASGAYPFGRTATNRAFAAGALTCFAAPCLTLSSLRAQRPSRPCRGPAAAPSNIRLARSAVVFNQPAATLFPLTADRPHVFPLPPTTPKEISRCVKN